MKKNFKLSATLSLGLLVTLFVCNGLCVLAQEDPIVLKLQEAQHDFEQAFNTVLDAESIHANTTPLMNQLNDAAVFLSQAENAQRAGNNNLALSNADKAIQLSKKISSEAQTLKESTIIENQNTLWAKSTLTIIGSIVFISVMFILWGQFKRRYINKRLDGEPRCPT